MTKTRRTECMDCYYLRPGRGCVSEAEMFCGCCETPITPAERLEQLTVILSGVIGMMEHLMKKYEDKEDK